MDISTHPLLSHLAASCLQARLLALNAVFTDCAPQLERLVSRVGGNHVSLGDLFLKVQGRVLRASLPCASVAPERVVKWFRRCVRNLRLDRARKECSVHRVERRHVLNERPAQPRADLDAAIDLEEAVRMLDRLQSRLRKDQDRVALHRLMRLRQALVDGELEACSLRGTASVLDCSHTSARRFLNAMAAYVTPGVVPRGRRTAA